MKHAALFHLYETLRNVNQFIVIKKTDQWLPEYVAEAGGKE